MKAWQFVEAGKPLTLNEVPDPVAGPGEVVIDVKATGLCHSDVGFLHGAISELLGYAPITLGHEFAGVVSSIGEGVTDVKIGDAVGNAGLGLTAPGVGREGGYAPKVAVNAAEVVAIPSGVGFAYAAAGTDAGATSYDAVHVRAQVKNGDRVGIIGLGGLGMIGARIAVVAGAEVYGAEVNTAIHDDAREIGVREVVADAAELARFELDTIIDFAGFGTTTAAAIEAVKPHGRVVLVGLGRPEATISTSSLVSRHIELVGSGTETKDNVAGVYALMGAGQLTPTITTIGFDEIPEGLERLGRGGVRGRLVALLGG